MSISRSRSRRSGGSKRTGSTSSSKNTGPHDRAFHQTLIDHNIYPPGYTFPDGRIQPKPGNWEEIRERLAQPRASLSPSKFSDTQFSRFVQANDNASKEHQTQTRVLHAIEGELGLSKNSSGKIPFTNLAPLTGENLVAGNPDVYYGARPEQLEREVRDQLENLIVPSTQRDSPIIPNHVTAAKGPDGNQAVAVIQATYDAALGGRAMHALQSFGEEEPQYDGKAYTFANTYQGGHLRMFSCHLDAPRTAGSPPSYHVTPIRSFSMIDEPDTFRAGATWYRNSIDLAAEWRNHAIDHANEIADQRVVSSSAEATETPVRETFVDDSVGLLDVRQATLFQADAVQNPHGDEIHANTADVEGASSGT